MISWWAKPAGSWSRRFERFFAGAARKQRKMAAGGVRMDLDRHEVTVNGRLVALTTKEFAILRCFLAAPGRVFSRDDMLNNVWGQGYALEEHALDVHIHALRHKIERNPARPTLIVTVRGLGYKLKAG
jgi:two-component system, OmpR family, response regulator RegX3